MVWSALVLAVALSLDGLGVGVAYGIRKIRTPLSSLLIIATCSIIAMSISMLAGHSLVDIAGINTSQIGAVIIIGVGLWQLYQSYIHRTEEEGEAVPALSYNLGVQEEDLLFKISLKPMGLVIRVLRTPAVADMDGSGAISSREAFILGFALAIDAFGAGFGAALAGFSLSVIPLVALSQILMVSIGRTLSANLIPLHICKKVAFLPGIVLILIGVLKF
jgi:putative sporulation protein YtaF